MKHIKHKYKGAKGEPRFNPETVWRIKRKPNTMGYGKNSENFKVREAQIERDRGKPKILRDCFNRIVSANRGQHKDIKNPGDHEKGAMEERHRTPSRRVTRHYKNEKRKEQKKSAPLM